MLSLLRKQESRIPEPVNSLFLLYHSETVDALLGHIARVAASSPKGLGMVLDSMTGWHEHSYFL
jgi:hypothetical protein